MDKCGPDDLNARNNRGLSVLDVVLETPKRNRNPALEGMIRTAGGTTTNYKCSMWAHKLLGWSEQLWQYLMPSSVSSPQNEQEELQAKGTQKTLMIVAVLLATITFQAAMTPPQPFTLIDSSKEETFMNPEALNSVLRKFLLNDILALVASLSTILVIICRWTGGKYVTRLLLWMTWAAVCFTLLAFVAAVILIYGSKEPMNFYILGTFAVTVSNAIKVALGYLILRLQLYILSKLKLVPCVKLLWERCLRKIDIIPYHPSSYDLTRRSLLFIGRAVILTAFIMFSYYLCYLV